MNGVLEVAIGLGFVYLLFSAIASSLVEWASAMFDRRAKTLRRSLNSILGPDLRRDLLAHPAISGINLDESADVNRSPHWLWWPDRTPPNYLPARSVAIALADIARDADPPGSRMDRLFHSFKDQAGADAEVLFRLEKWFTEQMQRTSNQYKRWTQLLTLAFAILLTGLFDIDSLRIGSELYRNTALRTAVADQVALQIKGKTLDQVDPSLTSFSEFPIGWRADRWQRIRLLPALAGWLLSVVALGLGSPFWFDLVGRIVNLRQAGSRPPPAQFAAQ